MPNGDLNLLAAGVVIGVVLVVVMGFIGMLLFYYRFVHGGPVEPMTKVEAEESDRRTVLRSKAEKRDRELAERGIHRSWREVLAEVEKEEREKVQNA